MTFTQLQQFLVENPTKRISAQAVREKFSVRVSDVVSKASWNQTDVSLAEAAEKAIALSLGGTPG